MCWRIINLGSFAPSGLSQWSSTDLHLTHNAEILAPIGFSAFPRYIDQHQGSVSGCCIKAWEESLIHLPHKCFRSTYVYHDLWPLDLLNDVCDQHLTRVHTSPKCRLHLRSQSLHSPSYFFVFPFDAEEVFFPAFPVSTFFPPNTLTVFGQIHCTISSSTINLLLQSSVPFRLCINSFSRELIFSGSVSSSEVERKAEMADREAFPFFVVPGVSLTLYLHRGRADQGAQMVIASERMSSGFGKGINSLILRLSSWKLAMAHGEKRCLKRFIDLGFWRHRP